MKVILLADVKGHGSKGQLVEASDGYARNFLFPRKLAVPADAQNMTEMKNREDAKKFHIAEEKAAAQSAADRLNGQTIVLQAKAGSNGKLFGSITSKEISDQIKKSFHLDVDKKKISVGDIKAAGEYSAEVRMSQGISATLKITVKAQEN